MPRHPPERWVAIQCDRVATCPRRKTTCDAAIGMTEFDEANLSNGSWCVHGWLRCERTANRERGAASRVGARGAARRSRGERGGRCKQGAHHRRRGSRRAVRHPYGLLRVRFGRSRRSSARCPRCFGHVFHLGSGSGKDDLIVGHADPRGEVDYNFALGQGRAGTVEAYVVGRGLKSDRVESSSRGELDATGHDAKSWALDRNVAISILAEPPS